MTAHKPLVVFSDDWGRHPSSCQHLVRQLLGRCEVTWVNTIGTRPPRLDLATVRRGLEKLRHWGPPSGLGQPRGPAPRVLNPLMWPAFQRPWQRKLNRRLLQRRLEREIPRLAEATVLTTVPIVADLIGSLPVGHWVYYCVDDFSQWPGLDGQTLESLEVELIEKADLIVAAGDNLAERIRHRGREAIVLTHGVDLDHWQAAGEMKMTALDALKPPRIVFWGLVDRRLDTSWLATLSTSLDGGSIVLVGPQQNPDPVLGSIPHLTLTGPIPYEQLPSVAAAADVLIMPYADLPVTRAMQPLKLKEYLATGKPVVVRKLPATADWSDCLDEATTAEQFAAGVRRRLAEGVPAAQAAARARLADEGWPAKAAQLRQMLWPEPAVHVECPS